MEKKIALLIDAENVPASYVDKIFAELKKVGTVIIKRAYADWSKAYHRPARKKDDSYNLWEVLNKWYAVLSEKGITPVLQIQNTVGKNSSDICLVIDAMDIFYTSDTDVFCIVSSDGDFTKLASRLVEGGKKVIVMGESQTPKSVRSVSEFILLGEAVTPKASYVSSEKRTVRKKPDNKEKIAETKSEPRTEQKAEAAEPADIQPAPVESEKPKPAQEPFDAREYDRIISDSIKEIISQAGGQITYQQLLAKLRIRHPDCDVIKVGEKPIEIFKNLPFLKVKQEGATYYFTLKREETEKPADEAEAASESETQSKPAKKSARRSKTADKDEDPATAEPAATQDEKPVSKPRRGRKPKKDAQSQNE